MWIHLLQFNRSWQAVFPKEIADFFKQMPELSVLFPILISSWIIGRYVPNLLRFLLSKFLSKSKLGIYDKIVVPVLPALRSAGMLFILYFSLHWLASFKTEFTVGHSSLYQAILLFLEISLTLVIAWLFSRLSQRFFRVYAVQILRKMGQEADDVLLVFENLANVAIGLIVALAFARFQQVDIPVPVTRVALVIISAIASVLLGRYTPLVARTLVLKFASQRANELYRNIIEPASAPLSIGGTVILISFSFSWLEQYSIYKPIRFFSDFVVVTSIAWLAARICQQLVRIYAVNLLKRFDKEADDLLLVFENIINFLIFIIAVLAFAQSQSLNLVGFLASLGIASAAVVFASQRILEQLLSTIVLYLDRPFVTGDYIRLKNGNIGRVESIGLRSTKIRTSAQNTLFIVPNSNLVDTEIENLTRAKKLMVMLYLDFSKSLDEPERALVKQVVKEGTDTVFGIDPGSTSVSFIERENSEPSQARVTFFILGSNEGSLQLRKRLLETSNAILSRRLRNLNIDFIMNEPTVYVESKITL